MCATPSYHYETKSRWQIKGTDSPIILKSQEASKLMSDINEICNKFNIKYLNQYNSTNNSNSNNDKLPEPLRNLINWLEIPSNFQFRINEGARHNTMISFANSLLFRYRFDTNVNRKDGLKTFFFEVNNKICLPEPLPHVEIKAIWKDALKHSEEKSSKVNVLNNDENDVHNYNSRVVIQLEKGDKFT